MYRFLYCGPPFSRTKRLPSSPEKKRKEKENTYTYTSIRIYWDILKTTFNREDLNLTQNFLVNPSLYGTSFRQRWTLFDKGKNINNLVL